MLKKVYEVLSIATKTVLWACNGLVSGLSQFLWFYIALLIVTNHVGSKLIEPWVLGVLGVGVIMYRLYNTRYVLR